MPRTSPASAKIKTQKGHKIHKPYTNLTERKGGSGWKVDTQISKHCRDGTGKRTAMHTTP